MAWNAPSALPQGLGGGVLVITNTLNIIRIIIYHYFIIISISSISGVIIYRNFTQTVTLRVLSNPDLFLSVQALFNVTGQDRQDNLWQIPLKVTRQSLSRGSADTEDVVKYITSLTPDHYPIILTPSMWNNPS